MSKYYGYDIETFPNVFTCCIQNIDSGKTRVFEISDRKNDTESLKKTMFWLSREKKVLVGYNNIGFDYPVIDLLLKMDINLQGSQIAFILYTFAMSIIDGDRKYVKNGIVEQLDLLKVHHFDNKAKRVSLKVLEFNMKSKVIEDLPFKPGTKLTNSDIDTLIDYNKRDVNETIKFFHLSKNAIKFREDLSITYNESMMNYSDMKIGTRYFVRRLEERLGKNICYINGKPRQTKRESIDLGEVIFPCIKFETEEFNSMKNWISQQVITETKGVFEDANVVFNDFKFDFGTGGLHGSIEAAHIQSDDDFIVIDVDVASYYPSIVIHNRLYPEHLGEEFADIYEEVKDMRFQYDKGTPENKMFKLALNAAGFGDTNNEYSPFYDPKMTMTVTINGQLMLCMLAEKMMTSIDSLSMIQANTDGLTVRLKRDDTYLFTRILKEWEQTTGMVLERIDYADMWIRDVNAYIAKTTDGKIKKTGAYKYELDWHQNHSALIIQKAVEANLLNNAPVEDFIRGHKDKFDFMLRVKVGKDTRLILELNGFEKHQIPLQNTTRYFISNKGYSLKKIIPPLEPNKCERLEGINIGSRVEECNNSDKFSFENLNYDWYIKQAKELINPLFRTKQPSLFDFLA